MTSLARAGVGRLFGPGASTQDIARYIREWFAETGETRAQELPPARAAAAPKRGAKPVAKRASRPAAKRAAKAAPKPAAGPAAKRKRR
jgi:hypothetical protein